MEDVNTILSARLLLMKSVTQGCDNRWNTSLPSCRKSCVIWCTSRKLSCDKGKHRRNKHWSYFVANIWASLVLILHTFERWVEYTCLVSCLKWTQKFLEPFNCSIKVNLHEAEMNIYSIQSGRAVWGTNCLRSLQPWDRGFDCHSRHCCLCVCVYSVFVLSCV
jgi:hypothetical protein